MIARLLRRLNRPEEEIVLEKREFSGKDGLGNQKEVWTEDKELIGIIQVSVKEPKDSEGERDITDEKTGYFLPFELPDQQNYRIKRTLLQTTPIVEVYDIIENSYNLVRRGRQNHVEVGLRLCY